MFSVRWTEAARDRLAAFWLDADSAERRAITEATRDIDVLLKARPEEAGESRDEDRRIVMAPPLGVIFKVEPFGRTVRVVNVLRFRRRGTR